MIRVAFANSSGDKTGGAEDSLALLIRYLPRDVKADAVLFGDGAFASKLRSCGINVHVVPIDVHLLNATREHPSIRGAAGLPASILKVSALLRRERFDAVHSNNLKAHFVAAPAARLCGMGSVVHIRDMADGLGRRGLRFVGKFAATRTIAVSSAVADWYGFDDVVLPDPIDMYTDRGGIDKATARQRLGIPNDLPLISIVGRINRLKGHDLFLRVAARISRARNIRCAIVGEARFRDEDFVPELHALAHTLGIQQTTHFIPWQDDLRYVYAATDVLCNCTKREGFGRTMSEAAAMGVPAVAFDDGGGRDIIEHGRTGYIVASGDEAAFSGAVQLLLDDSRARAFGDAAQQGARRFDPRTHADAVAHILRKCASLRVR